MYRSLLLPAGIALHVLSAPLASAAIAAVGDASSTETVSLHQRIARLSRTLSADSSLRPVDFPLVRWYGFTCLRVPVPHYELQTAGPPGSLNPACLKRVDEIVNRAFAAGLGVSLVIRVMPQDGDTTEASPRRVPASTTVKQLQNFAAHFGRFDPELLFLEVPEDPFELTSASEPRARLVQQIAGLRKGAPRHTLIAREGNYPTLDDLLRSEPLPDDNLVYAFRYHEPDIFTYQGLLLEDTSVTLASVPYPSSPSATRGLIRRTQDDLAQEALRSYGTQRWNAKVLRARLGMAAAWASTHKVPVVCYDIGVYSPRAEMEDLLRWFGDVTQALSDLNIGFAVTYEPGLCAAMPVDRRGLFEPRFVEALNLHERRQRSLLEKWFPGRTAARDQSRPAAAPKSDALSSTALSRAPN